MPHLRKRYATPLIQHGLRHSGIVGVFGHRQVGKTTLLEEVSREYLTFDSARELTVASSEPDAFLAGRSSPFGIDEAQLCPPLFPALKDHVRKNKRKGLFLLSGSVRFTSRNAIRESLTGRIVGVEVLPFTIAEAAGRPLPRKLFALGEARDEEHLARTLGSHSSSAQLSQYLRTGGLPGICFFRNERIRNDRFEAQLDTILSRDFRLIYETTLVPSLLKNLLVYLARHQGRPFVAKEASRFSQISIVTLKRVLWAFQGLFLIRELPASAGSEQRKTAYFLEDQGLASWLTRNDPVDPLNDLTRGLYANLRQEIFYDKDAAGEIQFFRTRNDVDVPLVFRFAGKLIGLLPTPDANPSPKILGAARSFLARHPGSRAVLAYEGNRIRRVGAECFLVPYHWLL